MYFAHKTESGEKQPLIEHLKNTADRARSYSVESLSEFAYICGLFHDIGKYSIEFQRRLDGENIHTEHSLGGAIKAIGLYLQSNEIIGYMLAYCIAGHHSGLPDGGTARDGVDDTTLSGRMKRPCEDYSAFSRELEYSIPKANNFIKMFTENCIRNGKLNQCEAVELYTFFTKYLFSCLTDADFLDTEHFCSSNICRSFKYNFDDALYKLNEKFSQFNADTDVRKARVSLKNQAAQNLDRISRIFILNMPTGSGKTLCSMNLALKLLKSGAKKRIIYVIPYTSIIEQTAEVFEEIFEKSLPVLQHYSSFSFEEYGDDNENTAEKLKRSSENWDAPFVITTNVQFFQSLYHYKSSKLRKLHNLADSVIVFDEIHTLPIEYVQPCLRVIGYITKYLNSTAIFLSATMPDFNNLFSKFMPDCKITPLITDKSLFKRFSNVEYIYLGEKSYEAILTLTDEYTSNLIIVNSRKAAAKVFKMANGKKYHLSTYMTSQHRSNVIANIRKALSDKEKITVVSTSLIEAGVDLDFESVFREMAGLDSILQSGGRCNREGLREKGHVYIFDSEEKMLNADIKTRVEITRNLIKIFSDIVSVEAISEYYNRLFLLHDEDIEKNSIAKLGGKSINYKSVPFRTYANSFNYINTETLSVLVDKSDESHKLTEHLKSGDFSVKRQLIKYTASIFRYELDNFIKLGILDDGKYGFYILQNNDYYDEETGLNISIGKTYIP